MRTEADFPRLRRLSRRFFLVSFGIMAVSLMVLVVGVKLWVLDFQASSYARIAGATQARYDISQGDKRSMVAIPPDQEPGMDGPPFVHGILSRVLGFNPAKATNTSGLSHEFIGKAVYSDHDRLFIDAYNRAKGRATRAGPPDQPVPTGQD